MDKGIEIKQIHEKEARGEKSREKKYAKMSVRRKKVGENNATLIIKRKTT